MRESGFRSFEDFWPHYVREHGRPATRWLHFAGTSLGIACVVFAIVSRQPRWLLAAPLLGYGPAWIGHFFVERNRPATFRHPWWSLLGDLRMFWAMLTGGMREQLERAGVATRPRGRS